MPRKDVLFLTLKVFSATGGIEKVCRILGKIFWDNSLKHGTKFKICSMHDKTDLADTRYFPPHVYEWFSANKLRFGIRAIALGINSDVIVLSHVNLLLFGYIIKLLKPSTRIILLAHGIEVWQEFSGYKLHLLLKCDIVICVSNYTKQKMIQMHSIDVVQV